MPAVKRHSITYDSGLFHNGVATGVDIDLLNPGDGVSSINSIVIANTHDTSDATISLFLQNSPTSGTAKTFFIIKNVVIPNGVSLLLDDPSMLSFNNNSSTGFGLFATIGASDGTQLVDILIN
jgi:hypothetical protein